MATKAKGSNFVGKEKKGPSSNSHITTTKRIIKPSTTTNSTNKPNSTSSKKNIPNYLKPTLTSQLDSPSSKQIKSDSPNNKPSLNKRRSLDKPLSSSTLTKQIQPSNSTLHDALVSTGSRERSTPRRSSIGLVTRNTNPSKPISDTTSKIPSIRKTRPLVIKSTKKISLTTTTTLSAKKKSNTDHVSVNSTNKSAKEIKKTLNVETEQVKEVATQEVEVIKVENKERKVHQAEHVTDISPNVDSEHDIEHVLGVDNSDPFQNQVDDERIISIVSEAEEIENGPLEEKAKDYEHELEDDKINQDEGRNISESDHQHKHFTTKEGFVVKDEDEVIIIEDHKSEKNNEKEAMEEEKEAFEGVEEAKVKATPSKQQLGERKQKNKESLSNDMIEETRGKLLETRKNKVMALAGAFQTVIDYQTTSR
ncbi:lebercilin [Cajanus cajan]|uniref:Calmodulin-binding domain-containing protein n=1 Tax=Cajanus cajan TaxID=3821 RepID=A0A151TZ71_CAJCA|nr:lebercilin [Cajanus cajan]KYP72340.1 hypothetical protein KK1_004928 [Cajanus cajan]